MMLASSQLLLMSLLGSLYVTKAAYDSCQVAQQRCVTRIGCGMALSNFFIDCGTLLHGETDQCNKRCKKALISLLSTDDKEGEDFIECDCNGNNYCMLQKNRTHACAKVVVPAMKAISDEKTAISCSLAEMICRADSPCLTALRYYEENCSKLIRGERCTSRCNNSLSILYRTEKARKLRNCVCDGTEELDVPCETLQANTEQLCFGRTGYLTSSSSSFSLDDDTVTHHHRHKNNGTRGHSSNTGPHTSSSHAPHHSILSCLLISILLSCKHASRTISW